MTFPLTIQPEAEADLTEAYRWYEGERAGLGREFLECVEQTFGQICDTPELYAIVYRRVRQTLVKRFPYVVCYIFDAECVNVVAVFHGRRDPDVWKSRVPDQPFS